MSDDITDCGSTEPRRLGLIGDPVAHSLSPVMQQAALDALGINATYTAWPTPAAELRSRIDSLRARGVLGANVTVPHKLAVMDLIDETTALARRAGAVNTILHWRDRLIGDNTDVGGFAAALLDACPNAGVRPALVLGAGGAARSVILALEGMGVEPIAIANRDRGRAERLIADLAPTHIRYLPMEPLPLAAALVRTGLLINATSLGWHAGETPLPLDLLAAMPPNAFVVDLTYRDTDLLLAARALGLATLDGLPMLVHQGAQALALWTGREPPIGVMMDAARQARAMRA